MSSTIERIASISGRILPNGGSMPDRYGQLIPADLPGVSREIFRAAGLADPGRTVRYCDT